MEPLRIATAQFEHRNGDKAYNLSIIRQLAAQAAQQGADVVAFHECSITGYKLARRPELYRDIIGQGHQSEQKVVWLNTETDSAL